MGHPTMQENDTAKLTPTGIDPKMIANIILLLHIQPIRVRF